MGGMTSIPVRQPKGVRTGGQFTSFPHLEPSVTLVAPALKDAAALAAAEAATLARRREFLMDQLAMVTEQQRTLACASAAHRVLEQHPDATVLVFAVKDSRTVAITSVLDGDGRILPSRRGGEWADSVLAELRQTPADSFNQVPGVQSGAASLRIDIAAVLADVAGRVSEELPRQPRHAAPDLAAV